MKTTLFAALAAAAIVTTAGSAEAAGGCGPGFHRVFLGRCVVNAGVFYGPRPGPYVYGRPGYWRGGPGWRYRGGWHRGWRYR